ncbi:MAG TPA: endonuclease/exonuclease/phosphatase family protein [Dongiaceae bacterium]|nr:endonuclease/exonuclease/phosphatase family protein [Dongiaceae bacterium]
MRRAAWLFLLLLPAFLSVPAGVRAAATGRAPSQAPAARLRVATWNLEWLARTPGQGPVPRRAADYRRLAAIAVRLDADLVALQEVDGPEAARRVFDPATYDFIFTGDVTNRQRTGFAVRRGLQVTRHPDLVDLAVETGARRGADLTVHLAGADLRLLAVHLKSGCAGGPIDGAEAPCSTLKRQQAVLESWIDARVAAGEPFLVLGDFNRRFEAPDRFWIDLDDGEPPGADLVDLAEGRSPACWGGRHRQFIDHAVLGRATAGWVVPGSFASPDYLPEERRYESTLSDHCPLRFTLDTARPPSPPILAADEAKGHVGEAATVCGEVASKGRTSGGRGRILVDLDRPRPGAPFTAVADGADGAAAGALDRLEVGARVCVSGVVRLYRGRAEIVVRDAGAVVARPRPVTR